MRENAIMWIVGLSVILDHGNATIIFYVFMQGVIEGYFLS